MSIRIAINGRCFTRRITGVERYAREIAQRLERSRRVIIPRKPLGPTFGHLWEQFVLPTRVESNDVLWSPANSGPWAVHRQIVTLHDASVFDHPKWFRTSFASWTQLSWRILARRASAIITDSAFSQERLRHHLHIPSEKIHVISSGVGRPFGLQTQKDIEEVLIHYNVKKPYIFFIGTNEPRKNLRILLEAWTKIAAASYLLVVAGGKGNVFAQDSEIPRLANAQSLGYVPDADLPALYAGATATIVPSLYEGFGLTALEAMACGSPVIASNTTSFPEVVGDAALLVDPNNPIELADALRQVIEDPDLARTLRDRGVNRASQHTWDGAARRIESLLGSL